MLRPRTLRARLAILFGLTTTVLAGGFGALLLHQARHQLAIGIDEGLVPVAAGLAQRVANEGPSVISGPNPELAPPSDAIAQLLTPDGRIAAASAFVGNDRPLLRPGGADRVANSGRNVVRQTSIPTAGGKTTPVRLLALPVRVGGQPLALVTATSFDESGRLEAEQERALTVGLPLLAALVAFGGWVLTGAMFKPVQSMIEQADAISAREQGERLAISGGGAELRALAARLNAMLDRIDDAAARERAFLDDASHELRTPISIVRGELELARSRLSEDDGLRAPLDSVLDEVERLERLAYNLLVLARSRSGTLTAGDTPVDLETVVERAARAIDRRAGHRHVAVHHHGVGVVVGDESSLQRAVLNLLDNAVRHAATEVTVDVAEHGAFVDLTVRDDGPGFSAEFLPHVFDRFTRDANNGGGMGL
ncbi:MAG TPA: ATP-binding protein, partial [Acidimicrobiia bacterium]|nr:ATP-binding protein [Acidimicrobiia bacterium]